MARQNARLEAKIRDRWTRLSPTLDERGRRLFVENEAAAVGYGGVTALHRATGVAESTIRRGVRALADLERLQPGDSRQRSQGGGRKPLIEKQTGLNEALEALIDRAEHAGRPRVPAAVAFWECEEHRIAACFPGFQDQPWIRPKPAA
ncbi:MAG: hypothetical protein ACI9VR_002359 [Cognaticolwellia sp.]|jgi:hypothetical protein